MKRNLLLYGAFVFFFSFLVNLYAEDVRVTSTFDKRSVAVNEEIHLTIRVQGAQGNIQAPHLPSFQAFDTFYTGRASHMTLINGVSNSSVDFSYVIIPKSVGKFVLDPIEVVVNGRSFKTEPIQIDVSGTAPLPNPNASRSAQQPLPVMPTSSQSAPSRAPASQQNYQAPPSTYNPQDDNIYVKAWVDKATVYPNEQVLLTYSLYTRYDTRYEGFQDEPQVSGFWIEEFPPEREIQRETVRINGKRYVHADIKQVALFPTAAADYTINPGTIKVSVRQEPQSTSIFDQFFDDSFFSGGSFFARRENRLLKPPAIQVKVKPFPEKGKPADFSGAVGNFRMTAEVDQAAIKQNEPVTMKIIIEGEGNIETLNKPKIPELPDFKIYDADTSAELFKTGYVIGGRKTFEIVFIPTKAGKMTIPKLQFSYFRPSSESYVTLETPEFHLEVEASDQEMELPKAITQQDVFKKDVRVEGHDIRFIQENLVDSKWQRIEKVSKYLFFAANILLTLLVLFGLWQGRQEKIFAQNTGLKRRRFAKSLASSRMKNLKKIGKSSELDQEMAYFEEVEKILTQYLSDKFNLSAYGMTRQSLEWELERSLGAEDALYKEILDLYRVCEESRFAKAKIPEEVKERAFRVLQDTIQRVEKLNLGKSK